MFNHLFRFTIRRTLSQMLLTLILLTLGVFSQSYAQTGVYTLSSGSATVTGLKIDATATDESSVYVNNTGNLTMNRCTTTKIGNTSNTDSSSQYGLNAGIYTKAGGVITMNGCMVSTNASGANGLFATGSGSSITISNSTVIAVGGNAHGADVTYSGSITLNNVYMISNGGSSSTLATDFGGGTVTANGGTYISADTTDGSHSAAIYSTVTRATAASYADCGGVIDGANSISIISTYLTGKVEGFKTWKTAPASGYATITVNSGALTVTNGDGFYVTGETGNVAAANIVVNNGAVINASSGNILNVLSSSSAIFKAINETLSGNLVADSNSNIVATLDYTTLTGATKRAYMTINSNSLWSVNSTSQVTKLTNTGTLSFTSAGIVLTDSGSFSSSGKLRILLGGDSNYNQINATGAVTVDGTLEVNLTNGYKPTIGQTFTIITRSSGSGSFSTLTSTSGLMYTVVYNSGSIVITITGVQVINGNFDSASDTSDWAFQQPGSVDQMPSYSWLSSYSGHTGILKLSYSSSIEGLKMTSISRIFYGAGNNWYRIRVQYSSDSPNSGHEIIAQMLSYLNPSSYTITEVGGNWTGNGQIVPGQWYIFDAYIFSRESSQQIQLILKNNSSTGDFYIDSIQCDPIEPPAIINPVSVPMTIGDFDSVSDTTSWGFQSISDGPNGMGTLSWTASVGIQSGVLGISFSQLTQAIKMTSGTTYNIASDRNALMLFNYRSSLGSPTTLHILGFLYSERDLATFKVDLAGKGNLGNFTGIQWNTMYIPLTSVSGNTSYRLQLVIKNNTQTPETVYIDDAQLYYSGTSLTSQQWVSAVDERQRSLYE